MGENYTKECIVFVMFYNVKVKQKKDVLKEQLTAPKCWIHLANEDNLRIKPLKYSARWKMIIHMEKPIKQGQFMEEYTGEKQR